MSETGESMQSKRNWKPAGAGSRTTLWVIVIVLLVALAGVAGYYVDRYNKSQKEVKRLSNPTVVAQQEQQSLISQVSKLTVLPAGETPTVATVTDISKLKDQAFFANAQNGDKVLIYTKAKKAYLFRPTTSKIINIAPVNLGNGQSNTTTGGGPQTNNGR